MNRIWTGYYAYLDEDGNEIDPCDFVINVTISQASFEGTAREDQFTEASGETVHVKGFFDTDIISFVKTYPFGWSEDDNGNILLHRDQPGHEVHYFGRLNAETLFWEGEWEIEVGNTLDPEIPGFIHTDIVYGPWKMKLLDVASE